MPDSHQIAANARPESQREPPFITGHPPERCSAQVAAIFHFGSFSPLQLMKRSMQAVEILMLTKWKEGEAPFLFAYAKRVNLIKLPQILDFKII